MSGAARWTDDDLVLMWQVGRAYGLRTVWEAVDEARVVPLLSGRRSPEEWHRQRLDVFEACAARTARALGQLGHSPYTGGPVPWERV